MKKKKAITPFLASVLLVVIVVGMAIIIGNWMKTTAKQQAKNITENSGIECTDKTINIDEVVYSTIDQTLTIKVRATGTENINIEKVSVLLENFSLLTYVNGVNFSVGTLFPGDVRYIILENVSSIPREVRVIPKGCGMNAVTVERDYFIIQ